ncbi:MAG TPA: GNVR domain-containing protein [Candidatus Acidoferrales bacterium]|nr:GNVR domain-containing protein [Candidatus Acidoferrum sp.]HUJ80229.1 GNVR domain-containing protein [Candidatus Acidoferrales bacterium]
MSEYGPASSSDRGMFGEFELKDYLDIARRRKLVITLTAAAVAVMIAVIVMRLPNFYRSETVIMVDAQQVSPSLVPSSVTSSVLDRLATIQQQVMSPSRLKKVADTLGLYPDMRGKVSDQDIIRKMQKATTIEVVNANGRAMGSFRIAFQGSDPQMVARTANELANQFIDENLRAREGQSKGTTDFLNSELQDTKKQLEAKEAEMGRIKSTYIMDLPESKQYHLEALTTLRAQLRQSQDRVTYDQQQKSVLQAMLATSKPAVDLDSDTFENFSPLQTQIQKTETSLSDLRTHYGPNYPDVKKLQAQLDDLKAKKAEEDKNNPPSQTTVPVRKTVKNPVIDAQLQKLDEEIATETKRQPQLQEEIDFHSSKLEREPVFEQQIAGLMRDYDTLRGHYNALLDKKLSAEMSTELDAKQEGERFVILDPAPVPDSPAGPNRSLLITVGVVLGLLAGFGLAVAIEMADETVRSEREAENIIGKGILVGIPNIFTRQQRTLKQVRSAAALAATVVLAAGLGYMLSGVAARFF